MEERNHPLTNVILGAVMVLAGILSAWLTIRAFASGIGAGLVWLIFVSPTVMGLAYGFGTVLVLPLVWLIERNRT